MGSGNVAGSGFSVTHNEQGCGFTRASPSGRQPQHLVQSGTGKGKLGYDNVFPNLLSTAESFALGKASEDSLSET